MTDTIDQLARDIMDEMNEAYDAEFGAPGSTGLSPEANAAAVLVKYLEPQRRVGIQLERDRCAAIADEYGKKWEHRGGFHQASACSGLSIAIRSQGE